MQLPSRLLHRHQALTGARCAMGLGLGQYQSDQHIRTNPVRPCKARLATAANHRDTMTTPVLDLDRLGAEAQVSEPNLHLILPENNLTAQTITEVLRGVEVLLAARAMASLNPEKLAEYKRRYDEFFVDYFAETIALRFDPDDIRYLIGHIRGDLTRKASKTFLDTRSDFFSTFLARLARPGQPSSLKLLSIRKGSYEFIFHTVNLLATFGLQNEGLIKDCVQWACSVIQSTIERQPTTQQVVADHRLTVVLTPELVEAFKGFRAVHLEERDENGKTRLFVRFDQGDGNAQPTLLDARDT